jgi:hypothetical protein
MSLFAAGVFLLSATASGKSMALGAAIVAASVLLLWLGS